MTLKTRLAPALLCCVALLGFFADGSRGTQTVFDVTLFRTSNGTEKDSSKALLKAWAAACHSKKNGEKVIVIPAGTFMVKPLELDGPCYKGFSPALAVKGTLNPTPGFDHSPIWIKFKNLDRLTLSGGGTIDGQGDLSWHENTCHKDPHCPRLSTMLRFEGVNNLEIYDLHLKNSKQVHISMSRSQNVSVHDITIDAPQNSPNTDGVNLHDSYNVTVSNSTIGSGDDCIAVGPGSTGVVVYNITCGPGHGISVGSLGKDPGQQDVSSMSVKNCTLKNTENGLRIKTWPGSHVSRAFNFSFQDITMFNVSNPIVIDQEYCPGHKCPQEPSSVEIHGVSYKRIRGTSATKVAVRFQCSKKLPCKKIHLENIDLISINGDAPERRSNSNSTKSICSNAYGDFSGIEYPPPCLRKL